MDPSISIQVREYIQVNWSLGCQSMEGRLPIPMVSEELSRVCVSSLTDLDHHLGVLVKLIDRGRRRILGSWDVGL